MLDGSFGLDEGGVSLATPATAIAFMSAIAFVRAMTGSLLIVRTGTLLVKTTARDAGALLRFFSIPMVAKTNRHRSRNKQRRKQPNFRIIENHAERILAFTDAVV